MIKSTENAEHYKWGADCDGWHLLQSDTLSVIQEKMPPGTAEQLHYHVNAQQVFYILTGIASFELAEKSIQVSAGQSLTIPKGSIHRICNTGEIDLHFLVISQPKSHGDRVNV